MYIMERSIDGVPKPKFESSDIRGMDCAEVAAAIEPALARQDMYRLAPLLMYCSMSATELGNPKALPTLSVHARITKAADENNLHTLRRWLDQVASTKRVRHVVASCKTHCAILRAAMTWSSVDMMRMLFKWMTKREWQTACHSEDVISRLRSFTSYDSKLDVLSSLVRGGCGPRIWPLMKSVIPLSPQSAQNL
jgi:hypothetical protein